MELYGALWSFMELYGTISWLAQGLRSVTKSGILLDTSVSMVPHTLGYLWILINKVVCTVQWHNVWNTFYYSFEKFGILTT